MTVNKFTTPPTPQGQINKINEIIDEKQDKLTSENAGTCIEITQSDVPSGHQELTYLQGDGTAYIETDVVPTNNTGMKIVFEYATSGSGATSGIYDGSAPRQDTFFISTNSGSIDNSGIFTAHRGATLSMNAESTETPVQGKTYTININYKNSGTMGIEGFAQTNVGTDDVLSNKVLLFARLNYNNDNITASSDKIKYVEFTEGTEVIRKYYPDRYNNELGLYDTITNTFLTNKNSSGAFTAGADVGLTINFVNDNGYITAVPTATPSSLGLVQPDGTTITINNGIISSTGTSSVDIDNKSITKNSSNELQTVGVIDSNNTSTAIKTWTGTRLEYDAILNKDSNTLYNITDDADIALTLLEALYPVGAIYIGTCNACPLQTLGIGTWQLVSAGRVLQGVTTGQSVGSTIEAGLPNITAGVIFNGCGGATTTTNGAFTYTKNSITSAGGSGMTYGGISFNASNSNSIYGNSNTVQAPAYIVNIWERVS